MQQSLWLFSDCYTIKLTESPYENKKKNDFWKLNFNMEPGISISDIWIDDPSKIRVSTSFHIATR